VKKYNYKGKESNIKKKKHHHYHAQHYQNAVNQFPGNVVEDIHGLLNPLEISKTI
jgi:hypothetical protein